MRTIRKHCHPAAFRISSSSSNNYSSSSSSSKCSRSSSSSSNNNNSSSSSKGSSSSNCSSSSSSSSNCSSSSSLFAVLLPKAKASLLKVSSSVLPAIMVRNKFPSHADLHLHNLSLTTVRSSNKMRDEQTNGQVMLSDRWR